MESLKNMGQCVTCPANDWLVRENVESNASISIEHIKNQASYGSEGNRNLSDSYFFQVF